MRTTLIIDDELFRRLKQRAAAEGRTLSAVTQDVLRHGLDVLSRPTRHERIVLPHFAMGAASVDLADRDRLLDVMDER